MLSHLIEYSLKNRFMVLILTGLVAGLGIYLATRIPIDAIPDMTNIQVTVVTKAGSLSPVEVERYVTTPLELSMSGLPRMEELRSISRLGISVLTVVFDEGTDIYWARQIVNERIIAARADLPEEYSPELGPLTTALGEIYQFEVRGYGYTSTQLRTMLDWEIAPKLRDVKGVTEINSHGGYYQDYEISPDPNRLQSYHLTLEELIQHLEQNNLSVGGGYIVHHGEQRFIRGQALLTSLQDIEQIVVKREAGSTPILLRDVAEIKLDALPRQGAVTRDGRGEAVVGLVMMLTGENSRIVVHRVKERLAQIEATLPVGVRLEPLYDRSFLIERTLHTVVKNLLEGGALVIIVLLIMLGSIRAGLIVALAIPLSMCFAVNLMTMFGVTASLMSLGAIDFGLIVDSSVIMIENCMHRLAHNHHGIARRQVIKEAAIEVRAPTMYGELIIAIVYLPILLLQGTEGKLFRPMAMTILFALFGSLILSMTFMPAMASIALPRKMSDKDPWLVIWMKKIYRPFLHQAVLYPLVTVFLTIGVFVASLPVAANLGAEFMPRLDEGDLLIEAVRLPTATIEDSIAMSTQIEKLVLQFPEVKTVFCKTGRPEIANDVMGVHQTDVWVMLHDRHHWPIPKSRDELITEMSSVLKKEVPGVVFGFTQPIEMRVDELVAGVKADVAVLLYGNDMKILATLSKEIENLLKSIEGAVDVKADYQANLSTLTITPDREALSRYGLDAKQVMQVISAMGGIEVGQIYEGRARFPVMLKLPRRWCENLEQIEMLSVAIVGDKPIPLREVAHISIEETPPSVEHESNQRRTYISANVRARDVASFVHEAQQLIAEKIDLPTGYEIRWGGDFENLQSASLRLMIILPVVLLLILLLLHSTLGSISLAALIFLAVPIAASGGIFALWIREMPFSISAGVGFIALFGVAVLNGLVWVSAAETLRKQGFPIHQISMETGMQRLRPVMMTAMVASLGFLPMAFSTSDGAEMQKPLASVVIGGLITSTLLTCFFIPAVYPWFASRLPKTEPVTSVI
jgi:cobalt-zinc-cadmium resistance protein CzcA